MGSWPVGLLWLFETQRPQQHQGPSAISHVQSVPCDPMGWCWALVCLRETFPWLFSPFCCSRGHCTILDFFPLTPTLTSFHSSAPLVNRPGALSLDDSCLFISECALWPHRMDLLVILLLSWTSALLPIWPLLLHTLSEAPVQSLIPHISDTASTATSLPPGHTLCWPRAYRCIPMSKKSPFILSSAFLTAYRLPIARNTKPNPWHSKSGGDFRNYSSQISFYRRRSWGSEKIDDMSRVEPKLAVKTSTWWELNIHPDLLKNSVRKLTIYSKSFMWIIFFKFVYFSNLYTQLTTPRSKLHAPLIERAWCPRSFIFI